MNDTQRIQQRLLIMAKVFHEFCEKHGLKYYMLGGTMLGAVRHKGFIPWDDDIDFGMMREDYEKFLSLRDEYPSGYSLNDYKSDKNFKYGFCKIYDENSTYIEKLCKVELIGGIFIDVFPLDNIGDDFDKAIALSKKIRSRKKIVNAIMYKGARLTLAKTIISGALQIMPKTNKWYDWIYNTIGKYKNKDSKYITNVFGASHEKETVAKEVFGEPRLYDFEDTKFYGVADYDKYLSRMYGDYMTPPPEDKRGGHSICHVEFDKPYKEYIKEKTENKK